MGILGEYSKEEAHSLLEQQAAEYEALIQPIRSSWRSS